MFGKSTKDTINLEGIASTTTSNVSETKSHCHGGVI